ncbi:hypothetical protein C1H70_13490 [Halomonas urumqiensis]|uniref:Uncharacterized protein n=1 Tax=Halomonas urumqiensis TaxID=1684789 RepID=A0A2N7UFW4_9GAMM|nr:hypothetical protein C1H70_13490 [Halomonas urumqiensis]PTB03967.1 hypothetical protein C6V82_05775 [Halomonas urumqiensis]
MTLTLVQSQLDMTRGAGDRSKRRSFAMDGKSSAQGRDYSASLADLSTVQHRAGLTLPLSH